jgi:hypothetical protein
VTRESDREDQRTELNAQRVIQAEQRQRLHDWMQATVRFLVLTNAGGAVATLTFVGSVWTKGVSFLWPSVALVAFFLGMVCVGLVIVGQLEKAWREELGVIALTTNQYFLGRWWNWMTDKSSDAHKALLLLSFMFFVFGATFGVASLQYVTPTNFSNPTPLAQESD